MKKVILATMLIFILIISSVTLFACNEKEKKNSENSSSINEQTNGAVNGDNNTDSSDNTIEPSQKDGNVVNFGSYPQTEVNDSAIKDELYNLAGTLPTSANSYAWTDYEYYVNGSVSSYMWYQDIEYNGEKYRGVFFREYRPTSYSIKSSELTEYTNNNGRHVKNTNQNENGYTKTIVYWFKFEPIKWKILTRSNGKALVLADLILDSQDYEPNDSNSIYSHNGGSGYANNYELSHIRAWLNDNFYNTAFNATEQTLIDTTTVDNSVSSTGYSSNSYECSNTQDKIFLLSYSEATNSSYGFSSDVDRQAKGSDYAKAQGLGVYRHSGGSYDGNSGWWHRSPWNVQGNALRSGVDYRGSIYDSANSGGGVASTGKGVRPACWIKL